MRKDHILPLTVLVLMITSCSTSNDVVQKGIFQHRKYNKPGWYIDIPDRARAKANMIEHRVEKAKAMDDVSADAQQDPVPVLEVVGPDVLVNEPSSESGVVQAVDHVAEAGPDATQEDPAYAGVFASAGGSVGVEFSSNTRRSALYSETMKGEASPAVPEDAGGVNIFALLGFIFAFLFPIAGLVLSIIGMNKTRGGGNGHGLAVAGLIISIVFLVIFGAVLI